MIKALIVDDEAKARTVLSHYLAAVVPQVTETRAAESVDEALEILRGYQPDIVFLDIEMPHRNGFDFLRALTDIPFDVIFTTAFNQYAISAIRFSALDYLMKPIDPEELRAAMDRYMYKRHEAATRKDLYRNLTENTAKPDFRQFRIAVPSIEGTHFFEASDILHLEADGAYTRIVLTNRKPFTASRSLKHFDEMLEDFKFIRTHKSHLVNPDHIKGMTADRTAVVLTDDTRIEISRRKKDEVMQLLGLR